MPFTPAVRQGAVVHRSKVGSRATHRRLLMVVAAGFAAASFGVGALLGGSEAADAADAAASDPCRFEGPAPGVDPRKQDGRRRLALLVGVADYDAPRVPPIPDADGWTPLRGTGNDLRALGAFLHRQGFEIRCLFDAEATKAGVLSAFRSHLVEKVRPGKNDVAVFYFSGHGQQVPDAIDRDEIDGYDEALVPYDHRGTADFTHHIRDDELRALTTQVERKTDSFLAIFDSCHSGSVTRGPLASKGTLRRLDPVRDPPVPKERARPDNFAGAVLTAARPEQTAREYQDWETGEIHGAFTYLLIDALEAAASSDRVQRLTVGDLHREVLARMPALGLPQEPMLDGDPGRLLFGGALVQVPRAIDVGPVDRYTYTTVNAGSVHGLTKGTLLALFPRDQDLDAIDADDLAKAPKLAIRKVTPAQAKAEPVDDRGEKLRGADRKDLSKRFARGGNAFVVEQPSRRDLRVRLQVRPKQVAAQLEAWTKHMALEIVPPRAKDYDLWLRAVPAADLASCHEDPRERPDRPVQLVTREGAVVPIPVAKGMPPVRCFSAKVPRMGEVIAQAIEAYQVRSQLVGLMPEKGERGLDVSLSIVPLGKADDGECPQPADLSALAALDGGAVKVDDCFAVIAHNQTRKPVHVSLLVVDPDLSILHLFPTYQESDQDEIAAGAKLALGVFYATEPPGNSTFKLIATEKSRVDTRPLAFNPRNVEEKLAAVRGGSMASRGAKGSGGLQKLINARAGGVRTGRAVVRERWGTAAVELTVSE